MPFFVILIAGSFASLWFELPLFTKDAGTLLILFLAVVLSCAFIEPSIFILYVIVAVVAWFLPFQKEWEARQNRY